MNSMYQEDPQVRARQAEYSEQEKQLLLMEYATKQLNEKDAYGMGQGDVAKASKESVIYVRIPTGIARSSRFVNVASLTPLPDVGQDLSRYVQRLQKMLLDPRHAPCRPSLGGIGPRPGHSDPSDRPGEPASVRPLLLGGSDGVSRQHCGGRHVG